MMVLVLIGLALSAQAATPVPTVFDYLKGTGYTRTLTLLDALGINAKTVPAGKLSGTLLVPTNQAWDSFLKAMHLTEAELKARPSLLDIIIGYHYIPGVAVKGAENVKANPTIAATGDINYILRFFKEGDKVTVQDVQGNTANILKTPVAVNRMAIVPIDRVLLSGGYFTSDTAALKHYPQWSEAFAFASKANLGMDMQDYTMFVPVNSAFTPELKKTINALPPQQQRDLLLYHYVKPALHIPNTLKDKKYETMFKGHFVGVNTEFIDSTHPTSGKPTKTPVVKVYPEVGSAAKVVLYNIFVRKGVMNGISKALVPKLPAAASSGRRMLSTLTSTNRRSLLQRMSSGLYQQYANTVAETNTAAAIDAAASGNIPVSYATTYGNTQATIANPSNTNCMNCLFWQ